MMHVNDVIYGDVLAGDVIRAAMERLGQLAPGMIPSNHEIQSAIFHLSSMMEEKFPGSPSQLSLELARRLAPTNRNEEVLREFKGYCKTHPEQRFWQALRNWSEVRAVILKRSTEDPGVDTFYWDRRRES